MQKNDRIVEGIFRRHQKGLRLDERQVGRLTHPAGWYTAIAIKDCTGTGPLIASPSRGKKKGLVRYSFFVCFSVSFQPSVLLTQQTIFPIPAAQCRNLLPDVHPYRCPPNRRNHRMRLFKKKAVLIHSKIYYWPVHHFFCHVEQSKAESKHLICAVYGNKSIKR